MLPPAEHPQPRAFQQSEYGSNSMSRRKQPCQQDRTEVAIRQAGSIGALERLAGIGGAPEERAAFWQPFSKLPGAQGLDAGVAELKRIIRAQAQKPPERAKHPAPSANHA